MRATTLLLIALCSLPLLAQRHKLNVNGDTPEGQLLLMIGQEAEGAPRRTAMMESFLEMVCVHGVLLSLDDGRA